MIALRWLGLAVLTSPFKSRCRLSSGKCSAAPSGDSAAASGARPGPAHKPRSVIYGPVPIEKSHQNNSSIGWCVAKQCRRIIKDDEKERDRQNIIDAIENKARAYRCRVSHDRDLISATNKADTTSALAQSRRLCVHIVAMFDSHFGFHWPFSYLDSTRVTAEGVVAIPKRV